MHGESPKQKVYRGHSAAVASANSLVVPVKQNPNNGRVRPWILQFTMKRNMAFQCRSALISGMWTEHEKWLLQRGCVLEDMQLPQGTEKRQKKLMDV